MKVPGPAFAAVLLFLASAVPSGAESPSVDLSQPIGADQAVRLALARNYDVRLAQDQLGQARAGRLQAYGGMVPRLTADYGYTHASRQSTQQPPNPLGSGSVFTSDSRGYNVSADQTLLSLPVLLNIAAQRKSTGAAGLSVRDAERQVAFGVRQQYYSVIEAMRLEEVNREDLRLANEELRRTESLFDVGSVARTDVLKARVRVAEAQSALTGAENTSQLQQSRLVQILALPTGTALSVIPDLDPRSQMPDSAAAYATALQTRPDLKAARLRVGAARSEKKAAVTDKLPFLNHSFSRSFSHTPGTGAIAFNPETFDVTIGPVRTTSSDWTYHIGFTWNILDGLVTESNIQRTSAQQSQAENQAGSLALQVGQDVKEALLAIRTARAQIVSAREGLASAEEDLKLSQERYSVGLGTILELIDAQVALTRARSAEVQAMAGLKIAEAQLDRATGVETW